jgi:hypothetical protein|tara:strand:+ start:3672 stop:3926 length:255 start_codon:yes stop_codon:yes gene_type:complete
MKKNMKMIECIKCRENMPELRLSKFGYRVCVNCSTIGAYKAVSTVNGIGDHTWNDIQIMTPDQAEKYEKQSMKNAKFDSYSQDA